MRTSQLSWYKRFVLNTIYFLNLFNQNIANFVFKSLKRKEMDELKNEINENKIRSVLINRSDRIGDAVTTIRLINALKEKFEDVTVLASEKNLFVFKENKALNVIIKSKEATEKNYTNRNIITAGIYFLTKLISKRNSIAENEKKKYDLIIDFFGTGEPLIKEFYPARYIIGPNKGILSIAYSSFYKTSFPLSQLSAVESCKQMLAECLGISITISDSPPDNFLKLKQKQIMIFVGCVPARNISYEKWKEIILNASKLARCVVADDPTQEIISKLKEDNDIIVNNNIELIVGEKTLDYLANVANRSKLLIIIDGGAEHYLQRYTNAFVIYTVGLPIQWKPYSSNNYRILRLPDEHVYEETETSNGLKKMVFYKQFERNAYNPHQFLFDGCQEIKDINVDLMFDVLRDKFSKLDSIYNK